MLRRLIAILLAACFGLFSAEALVADVHDGDAARAELARLKGSAERVTERASERAADHPATHVTVRATAVDGQHHHDPAPSGHTQHACHCVHAHSDWVHTEGPLRVVIAAHAAPPALAPQAHPSRFLEPALRPPILQVSPHALEPRCGHLAARPHDGGSGDAARLSRRARPLAPAAPDLIA
jgi:hypothetical protein